MLCERGGGKQVETSAQTHAPGNLPDICVCLIYGDPAYCRIVTRKRYWYCIERGEGKQPCAVLPNYSPPPVPPFGGGRPQTILQPVPPARQQQIMVHKAITAIACEGGALPIQSPPRTHPFIPPPPPPLPPTKSIQLNSPHYSNNHTGKHTFDRTRTSTHRVSIYIGNSRYSIR